MRTPKRLKKEEPVEKVVGRQGLISFRFDLLHEVSYTDCQTSDFFIKFLKRLKQLCSLNWNEINASPRHSFGYEKIPINSIKKEVCITKEINFLFAFRATGDNRAFLGFRDGDVFQVVFVESNFGDIYEH